MTTYAKENIGNMARGIHIEAREKYIKENVNYVLTKIWPKDFESVIMKLSTEGNNLNPEHCFYFEYPDLNPKCPKGHHCIGFKPKITDIIEEIDTAVKKKCQEELGVQCSFELKSSFRGRNSDALDEYKFKVRLYDKN